MDALFIHSITEYEARICRRNSFNFRIPILFQNLFDFKEIYWTFCIIHLSLILSYKYIIENNNLCVTASTDLSTRMYSNLLPFYYLRDFIYWTLIVRRTLFYSFLLLSYGLIDILYWILVVCFRINKYGIKIFASNVRGI